MNEIGKHVALAIQAHCRRVQQEAGIHRVCEGVYFVTKPETVEALREHFEETMTFMGVKIMAPKKRG